MDNGKTCSKCGTWKPFSEGFYKNASSPDGFYSVCKACRKPLSKAWRMQPEVKAKEKERLAKAYQDNREVLLERRHQRWVENKAHETAKREALLAQPGKRAEHRERCKRWAKANPEKMRLIVRKRRAAKMGAEGSHTQEDIDRLYLHQGGVCVYCQSPLQGKYEVDHIHPLSRGGSNNVDNLQLTCTICNRMKGDKLDWQFDRGRYEQLAAS